jgi:neutral ceramidase
MADRLHAGVARRAINPPLGTRRVGPRIYGDPIESIANDLTATVCVLALGPVTVVVMALDLCEMLPSEALGLRRAVGAALGTPVSHVLLNMSHNHSCPALPGSTPSPDSPVQQERKERYERDLAKWLVEVSLEARGRMVPVRIGSGWGHSDIGVYRREVGPDGRDALGEVPGHAIDDAVGVIRIDDLDGRLLATMFSFGCHGVVVGPRSRVATTDYPGPARRTIESVLGGTALFLQACGGNINPRLGIGYATDGLDDELRVGATLGAEVVRVLADIRTAVRAGERVTFGDVPGIYGRPWQPISSEAPDRLAAIEDVVELEYGPLPSLADATGIRDACRAELAARLAGDSAEWEVRVARMFSDWSDHLVSAVTDGHPTHALTVQAIRINDVALTGMSMETFFETGLEIKLRSPIAHTQVLGYTNGSTGYLPRREDYPPGGWQINERYRVPDLFVQAYMHPVALDPGAEQVAVNRALGCLERLI